MSSTSIQLPIAEGRGSVSDVPSLPDGFTDTFSSRFVDIGELRLHAVIGGDGPPLLLIHGWPQSWYAWRMLMPTLAREFEVIAVDQRGIGLSDKPSDGYDTATLANDLARADGHARPRAVRGLRHRHRHADRVCPCGRPSRAGGAARLLAELCSRHFPIPAAVSPAAAQREALAPGVQPAPRKGERGAREGAGRDLLRRGVRRFGRHEEAACRSRRATTSARSPPTRKPSAASFELYREFPSMIAQNEQRKSRRLTMPVLAIGGEESGGEGVAATMKLVADDVRGAVLAGSGHWVAEQAPEQLLSELTDFLAPYPDRKLGMSAD